MGSEVRDGWERRLEGKGNRRAEGLNVLDDRSENSRRASEKIAEG